MTENSIKKIRSVEVPLVGCEGASCLPSKSGFFSKLFGRKGGTMKKVKNNKHYTLKNRNNSRFLIPIYGSGIRNKTKQEDSIISELIRSQHQD